MGTTSITTVLIYLRKGQCEEFITRAHAMDLETEQISLDEAKASSKRIREAGKALSNRSILNEISDRHTFSDKKTKKERKKEEQQLISPLPDRVEPMEMEEQRLEASSSVSTSSKVQVFDYEELQEDYGF